MTQYDNIRILKIFSQNKRSHYDQVLQGATKASSKLLNSIWSEQYKRRYDISLYLYIVCHCNRGSCRCELLQNYHKITMEELHKLEEDVKATQEAEEQAIVTDHQYHITII